MMKKQELKKTLVELQTNTEFTWNACESFYLKEIETISKQNEELVNDLHHEIARIHDWMQLAKKHLLEAGKVIGEK